MLLKTCLIHSHHLSLSWSFDIISHTETMIRPCTVMSYLRLTREALRCFRWPNSPPFSGHQHHKTKPPLGLSSATLPCPMNLLLFHKILCAFVLSVVTFWPCMWPQATQTCHVPVCLCSCHKALIATGSKEAFEEMHLAYLQNHIEALLSVMHGHRHILFLLSSCSRNVAFTTGYFWKQCYHTPWILQGLMGHVSIFECNTRMNRAKMNWILMADSAASNTRLYGDTLQRC
jgi:hypothetical protein